ncbi:Serine/threonine protein kinase [Malassezia caprae]|uniref:Serine/threonine protein kinase n=1 Tax=Malassezia caprae TaxID=1381934 RepID=A0AAF0ITZ8_9BASI|nr:Serine/threonine protein kinase [Malassezia caprae]
MTAVSPQHHRNLIGSRIADGRLQLVSLLGLGAYGVVYLARDVSSVVHQRLQRPPFLQGNTSGFYAVKCLNKVGLDSRQRAFQRREILLHTMSSSHPSVVTLHRVIDNPWEPYVYVILDYCADGDLFTMITEKQRYMLPPEPFVPDPNATDGRPLPPDEAYTHARAKMDLIIKDVFGQILDAVEHCHSLGIYHRDLKPENILCTAEGRRVLLADFGLATGDRTSADFGCGSSFYMGPECQGGITHRLTEYSTAANDVWSLGVILINFICGRNPWKQATPNDDTFREYLRDPNFLEKILPISDEVHAVLKRIFTLRPDARPSVSELRRWVHALPRLHATNLEIWERQHGEQLREQRANAERAARESAKTQGSDVTPVPPSASPTLLDDDCSHFSMLSLRSESGSATATPVLSPQRPFHDESVDYGIQGPAPVPVYPYQRTGDSVYVSTVDSPHFCIGLWESHPHAGLMTGKTDSFSSGGTVRAPCGPKEEPLCLRWSDEPEASDSLATDAASVAVSSPPYRSFTPDTGPVPVRRPYCPRAVPVDVARPDALFT